MANGVNKANIVRYFNSEWMKEPLIVLRGNKLDSIYENFLSQLSDELIDMASEEDISTKFNKTLEIQKLEQQIEKLTKKMLAEKQFNRQVAIRAQIKDIELQLQELKDGK